VPDPLPSRGLIDTSVVIELGRVDPTVLPSEMAISAITLAELAAGPHATQNAAERAARQERLQLTEATFDPIPFDAACARAYGRVYAETVAAGRKARGRRAIDLLIAATAMAAGLPVYTANPSDFNGLTGLITIVPVTPTPHV
jgi:predicted nucleic acid-binding protein